MKSVTATINKATLACLVGSFSGNFLSFGLGLYILETTDSALSFGVSQFLGPVICFFLSPYFMNLINRKKTKEILKKSILSEIIVMLLLAFFCRLNFSYFSTYWIVVILMSGLSIFSHLFSISYDQSCKEMVGEKNLKRLKSLEETSGSIALIASPIVASVFYSLLSISAYIVICILMEFLVLGIVLTIPFLVNNNEKNEKLELVKNGQGIIAEFKQESSILFKNPDAVFLIFLTSLMGFLFSSINTGLPFFQINVVKLSNQQYGLTKSLWAVGMLMAGILNVLQKNNVSTRNGLAKVILLLGLIPLFIFLYNLKLNGNLFFELLLFNFVFSFVLVYYRIYLSIYTLSKFKQQELGNVLLFQKTFEQLSRPIGIIAFGMLYDHFNANLVFIGTGMTMVTVGTFLSLNNECAS